MVDADKILNKELLPIFYKIDEQKPDIQGVIIRGYKTLKAATYILLKITNATQAKDYFRLLADQYITTAVTPSENITHNNDPIKALQIAFTSSGLRAVGLPQQVLDTFSREFIEGMSYAYTDNGVEIRERSTLLGDLNRSNPDNWNWGNKKHPVDCLLMAYAENSQLLKDLIQEAYTDKKSGVEEVYVGETFTTDPDNLKEHFGFRDGISQPVIKGFNKSGREIDKQQLVEPGEFLLGYKNEYDNFSPSPYVDDCDDSSGLAGLADANGKKDLGKNGAYMVFRQMEQHVEKFWKFMHQKSKEDVTGHQSKAVKLAAKMIGRWPNGTPLVKKDDAEPPVADKLLNNFYYANEDEFGIKCPLGAHIRRTNPRDQVHAGRKEKDSMQMSKRHRMLRRGRIYGEPLDEKLVVENIINKAKQSDAWLHETPDDGPIKKPVRGLHFICLVSDIARQFEFVQNVWANTATFGDLCNEVDPIISPRPTQGQPDCHEFTTPKEKLRNRYTNVPEFTTVIGGAYFFMPGITALKYIVKP